jgi:hypothetical protein
MYNESEKKLSMLAWIVLGVVVLVLAVAGYFLRARVLAPTADANSSGYQAVFLTNGQVYFGKISNADGDYVTLTNIYYLQANQALQGTTATQAQPFSLVKLGKELHGPTDTMYINRSQVLFYEDMRTDSSVVKSIESYTAGTGQ